MSASSSAEERSAKRQKIARATLLVENFPKEVQEAIATIANPPCWLDLFKENKQYLLKDLQWSDRATRKEFHWKGKVDEGDCTASLSYKDASNNYSPLVNFAKKHLLLQTPDYGSLILDVPRNPFNWTGKVLHKDEKGMIWCKAYATLDWKQDLFEHTLEVRAERVGIP